MTQVKFLIKYIKLKKTKLDFIENTSSDIRIGDLVNCWIKRYLRNIKLRRSYLYNYILEFKKIKNKNKNKFYFNDQLKLEKIVKKMQHIDAFKLICHKNIKIKQWYILMIKTLRSKLKFNNILNKRYIEQFIMCFFKSIAYCLRNDNKILSTLVSQLEQQITLILNTYDDFKYPIENTGIEFEEKIIMRNKLIIKVRNELFISAIQNDLINVSTDSLSKLKNEEPNINLNGYSNKYTDKITTFNLLKEFSFYMESYVQTLDFKPPMFIKPKKWRTKKKNKFIHYEGGYFNNLFLDSNFNENRRVELHKKYFSAINYLQNIPLKINKKYLNYLLQLSITHLLKEFPILNLEACKHFISDYKKTGKEQLTVLNEICFLLYFANLFKDIKLYYPHIHDWRGRTYPNCYPLHFYTTDIWKGLFMFYYNKKKKFKWTETHLDFLRNNSKNPSLFDEMYKYGNTFYSEKDFYTYKSIYNAKSLAMIGLDASSSSFQIQGLLIFDNDMLKYTNVLNNESKLDIYKYTSINFAKNFDFNNFKKPFSIKNKSAIIQEASKFPLWVKINITNNQNYQLDKYDNELFQSEEDFINFYKNNLINDRNLIKQIIMRLGYNQKLNSRINETYKYIQTNYLKSLKDFNFFFNEFIFNFCYQIENSFFELFQKQSYIRKFFIKSVNAIYKEKNKTQIIFSLFKGSHKVYQLYLTSDLANIWVRMPKSKKRYHFRYYVPSKIIKVDKIKTQLSTLPNYIQYLDSCILIEFVNLAKKHKINLKTIHDNFITDWDNIDKINDLYIYAMQTILLRKPHPLFTFMEDNNLLENKELVQLFNIITNFGIDTKILNNLLSRKLNSEDLFNELLNSNSNVDIIYNDIKSKMYNNKHILSF